MTRHNYSRWRRPGNLKTKSTVFRFYLFRIQTLPLENVRTILIVSIMLTILTIYSCFSGGSLKAINGVSYGATTLPLHDTVG